MIGNTVTSNSCMGTCLIFSRARQAKLSEAAIALGRCGRACVWSADRSAVTSRRSDWVSVAVTIHLRPGRRSGPFLAFRRRGGSERVALRMRGRCRRLSAPAAVGPAPEATGPVSGGERTGVAGSCRILRGAGVFGRVTGQGEEDLVEGGLAERELGEGHAAASELGQGG